MRSRYKRKRRSMGGFILFCILFAVGGLVLHSLGFLGKSRTLVNTLHVRYAIIDISGGKYKVSPELASGDEMRESFSDMVSRLKPDAAICGTYYDENNRPLGDIVKNGKVVCRGGQRQGIGFTPSGKIKFFERQGKSRINWSGCYSGIACGPRLVRDGKLDINVRRDGFSEVAARNEARRCAIGATYDGKLILCAVADWVTLDKMGEVMLELGAKDAVNLDGGSMCAFFSDGEHQVEPISRVNNIIVVHKKQAGADNL